MLCSCDFSERENSTSISQKTCRFAFVTWCVGPCKKQRLTLGNRFIHCEQWRKQFGVDELVRSFVYVEKPKVFEYYPQYYHKTDKVRSPPPRSHNGRGNLLTMLGSCEQDGRPVYVEQLGNIDLNAMYKITTADRMLQNLVVEYEKMADPRLPACSRKAGALLETSCTIMDLKGVGVSKVPSVYGYLQQASKISQDYYPERMGKLYLINAPWGFSSVFSFVKKFLDPVTVAKIHILGSGYEKELQSQVPKENLPKHLGGTCNCPGVACSATWVRGRMRSGRRHRSGRRRGRRSSKTGRVRWSRERRRAASPHPDERRWSRSPRRRKPRARCHHERLWKLLSDQDACFIRFS